jgi:hypothetical protein
MTDRDSPAPITQSVENKVRPKQGTPWGPILGSVAGFCLLIVFAKSAPWFSYLLIALPIAAGAIVLSAKFVARAPDALKQAAALLSKRPILFTAILVALGAAGLAGRSWRLDEQARCTAAVQRFDFAGTATGSSARDLLRQRETLVAEMQSARVLCAKLGMTTEANQIAAQEASVDAEKPTLVSAADAEAKAAAAQAQVEREAAAVAGFPKRTPEIRSTLATATKEAAQGAWTDSEATLNAAQVILNNFTGTSIEKNPQFASFQKQLNGIRAQIKPQIERLAAIEKARGPMPEFLGGCCLRCLSAARRLAHDPDSVECVQSTIPQIEGDKWVTTMSFRGKNGFGATVLNRKKFYLQDNQVVDVK